MIASEQQDNRPWISTLGCDGHSYKFYLDTFEGLNIHVIARGLALESRYANHTTQPLTVLQHTLACVREAEEQGLRKDIIRTMLFHDASEAYLRDLPGPVRKLCPGYTELIGRLDRRIAEKYDCIYPFPEEVHSIDKKMYRWERSTVAASEHVDVNEHVPGHSKRYLIQNAHAEQFLDVYQSYKPNN